MWRGPDVVGSVTRKQSPNPTRYILIRMASAGISVPPMDQTERALTTLEREAAAVAERRRALADLLEVGTLASEARIAGIVNTEALLDRVADGAVLVDDQRGAAPVGELR